MIDIPAQLPGYTRWRGPEQINDPYINDPYEDKTGPFFMKQDNAGGNPVSAFICDETHLNGAGFLHGGMLMTFADYALFVIASMQLRTDYAVTVSCQMEFLKGASPLSQPVFAEGEITRSTRSLIFIRGQIYAKGDTLATFSGILKKLGPSTHKGKN